MIQARESALACSATDASHVACEHYQVGEVKAIPQLANRRARTGADAREVLVGRFMRSMTSLWTYSDRPRGPWVIHCLPRFINSYNSNVDYTK
jgi:hypothetical protein